MILEQIVYKALTSYAPLVAVIGDGGSPPNVNLFYPGLPQNALGALQATPGIQAVTFQDISGNRLYTHGRPTEVGWRRFQFTCWCAGRDGALNAKQTARVLIAAFNSFSANNFNYDASSPPALLAAPNFVLNEHGETEPNTQPPIAKQILDVRIWFQDQ